MKKCEKCGQDLGIVRWNSAKEIILCCNDQCLAYRNPIDSPSNRDLETTFTSLTAYNHRVTLSAKKNYTPEVLVTVCGDSRIKAKPAYRQTSELNRHTLNSAVFPSSQQISRRVKELFNWKKLWLD